jgi:succinoglycan biosynthesis transport protein ExoP
MAVMDAQFDRVDRASRGLIRHEPAVMRGASTADLNPSANEAVAAEQIDLWGTIELLWRRKLQLFLLTAVIVAGGAYLIFQLTPQYHAEAKVLAGEYNVTVLSLNDQITAADMSSVQNDVQVLSSNIFARRMIEKLGLASDPEFNPTLREKSFGDRLRLTVDRGMQWVIYLLGLHEESRIETERADPNFAVLQNVLKKITVEGIEKSRAIRIGFVSNSPTTAAAVVNTLADLYQQREVDAKMAATKSAGDLLRIHLTELRDRAEAASNEVERYRRENGMLRGRDAALVAEQISNVDMRLVEAQGRLGQAEARLKNARSSIALPNAAVAIGEVLQSPLIQNLRQREAQLAEQLSQLSSTYGPKHPSVDSSQSQLESLRRTIATEVNKILQQSSSDVSRERFEVLRLTDKLNELRKEAVEQNAASARLSTLEREASANDEIYRTLLSRLKVIEVDGMAQRANSEIIARADVPTSPFFPNKQILLSLDLFVATTLAVVVLLIFEKRGQNVVSGEQVERCFGINALGFLPAVKGFGSISDALLVYQAQGRKSIYTSALQNLHVNLLLSGASPPQSILVASAMPGEGKSATAVAFALLLASTGRRTVVIDGDLRRPSLHRAFGMSVSPGLADYLAGEREVHDVGRCHHTSVTVITAGQETFHPADVLRTARMQELVERLRNEYDCIIIDSPPVIAVSDALVLGTYADATLFLVRWAKTPQRVVRRALQQFVSSGADIAGIVLSIVDVNRMVRERLDERYYRRIMRYHGGAS